MTAYRTRDTGTPLVAAARNEHAAAAYRRELAVHHAAALRFVLERNAHVPGRAAIAAAAAYLATLNEREV